MRKELYSSILVLLAILLAGCNVPGEVRTTEELISEPIIEATMELVTPTDMPEVVSECVSCHTNKDRLIDTAKPEEEVIKESEGAG